MEGKFLRSSIPQLISPTDRKIKPLDQSISHQTHYHKHKHQFHYHQFGNSTATTAAAPKRNTRLRPQSQQNIFSYNSADHIGFWSFFYFNHLERKAMFWSFLIISAIGTALTQLGAATVQAAIFSSSLKAALFVIAILAGTLLWIRNKTS